MNHVGPRADKCVYAHKVFVAILAYDDFVGLCSGTMPARGNPDWLASPTLTS